MPIKRGEWWNPNPNVQAPQEGFRQNTKISCLLIRHRESELRKHNPFLTITIVIGPQDDKDILYHGQERNGVDDERQHPNNVFLIINTIGESA